MLSILRYLGSLMFLGFAAMLISDGQIVTILGSLFALAGMVVCLPFGLTFIETKFNFKMKREIKYVTVIGLLIICSVFQSQTKSAVESTKQTERAKHIQDSIEIAQRPIKDSIARVEKIKKDSIELQEKLKGSEWDARAEAKLYVSLLVKYKKTLEFGQCKGVWNESGKYWFVKGTLTCKNAFGVEMEYGYNCIVRQTSIGVWELVETPSLFEN